MLTTSLTQNKMIFPGTTETITLHISQDHIIKASEGLGKDDNLMILLSRQPQIEGVDPQGVRAIVSKVIPQSKKSHLAPIQASLKGVVQVRWNEATQSWEDNPQKVMAEEDCAVLREGLLQLLSAMKRVKELKLNVQNEIRAEYDHAQVLSKAWSILEKLSLDIHITREDLIFEKTIEDAYSRLCEALELEIQKEGMYEELQVKLMGNLKKSQREALLREQIKLLQQDLGEPAEPSQVIENKMSERALPEHVQEILHQQRLKLERLPQTSSEFYVTQTYCDTLLSVPWEVSTQKDIRLDEAAQILEEDHYGLDKVKERLLEYLAVKSLKPDMRGTILCLSGPPGTGKSTLAKSIAKTLGRSFVRISLGGVRDENELRGHRRTYVGAMPGKIVKAIVQAKAMNPVVLLDEIDKLGNDHRGDPQSALLEILDPEQQSTFLDHYLDCALDLSGVIFIATANDLRTISAPLRDRMEIIDVPSYTFDEKKEIAKKYLLPRQQEANGINNYSLSLDLGALILSYTRESGVRDLERNLAAICRKTARKIVGGEIKSKKIKITNLEDYLGPYKYLPEPDLRDPSTVGICTGLAWTRVGGDVLHIETQAMSGKGQIKITGKLGEVMQESVHTCVTLLRSKTRALENYRTTDLHIHVPEAATPKDGPSAGVTIFCALYSLLMNIPIRPTLAMTGEITLTGQVLPVGGVREKVMAAHRAGIKDILIPAMCKKDLVEVPKDVLADINFHYAQTWEDVLDFTFPEKQT